MADNIEKLTDWQHARIRTEMYLSSRDPHTQSVLEYRSTGPETIETTWIPALACALREVLDNALDEVVSHGHGNRIDVTYDPHTMIISVADDGRGIPISYDDTHKIHKATLALTHTKAGRNFGERGSTRGLNGVGASVVNFCSEYFDVAIIRDKHEFTQRFTEGDGKNTDLIIEDPIIMPSDAKKTGTKITFKPSKNVFHDMRLPETFVEARMVEVALCYPSLKVFYNGKRIASKSVEEALFPQHKPIVFNIDDAVADFKSRFWLVPEFLKDGDYAHSLVNAIPMFNGGTHIDQFRKSFFSGLLDALEKESKKRKLEPNKSDISEGMLIYNITQMKAPNFDSQSKSRLINENVAIIIRKAMDDSNFFKDVIKKYPDWIEHIFERCTARTQKKTLADIDKTAKKSKREKVEDLQDACGSDRSKCILMLTEGKSAASGAISARDPDFHGALPLGGKPMNVREHPLAKVMANGPLTDIMKSVGLFPGKRVNRHLLRYGKIYLTTDADEDGKNIAALLVNFFYHFWPELFDPEREPFIYVFDTPLIIAVKGKNRKFWYKDDYESFDPDKFKGWEITRAKGLAALKKADWEYVLANPKLIPIVDDGKLNDALFLLFGGGSVQADARKAWIGL